MSDPKLYTHKPIYRVPCPNCGTKTPLLTTGSGEVATACESCGKRHVVRRRSATLPARSLPAPAIPFQRVTPKTCISEREPTLSGEGRIQCGFCSQEFEGRVRTFDGRRNSVPACPRCGHEDYVRSFTPSGTTPTSAGSGPQ